MVETYGCTSPLWVFSYAVSALVKAPVPSNWNSPVTFSLLVAVMDTDDR